MSMPNLLLLSSPATRSLLSSSLLLALSEEKVDFLCTVALLTRCSGEWRRWRKAGA